MSYHIKDAQLTDIPQLVALEKQSFIASDGMLQRRHFRYHLLTNNIVLTASSSTHPKTIIEAYLLALVNRHSVRIHSIAVTPEQRGKGYGKALIAALIERTKALDKKSIHLEVRESNHRAYQLYASLGFVQTHIRKNYYADENALRMQHLMPSKISGRRR